MCLNWVLLMLKVCLILLGFDLLVKGIWWLFVFFKKVRIINVLLLIILWFFGFNERFNMLFGCMLIICFIIFLFKCGFWNCLEGWINLMYKLLVKIYVFVSFRWYICLVKFLFCILVFLCFVIVLKIFLFVNLF